MAIKKVSVSKIKKIKVTEIGAAANTALQAIYVLNQLVFKGVKPMTQAAFQTIIDELIAKRTAFGVGGTSAKDDYDTALAALFAAMLLLAPYVDGIANGNEITLKLSTLPYTGATNQSGVLIKNGAVATGLSGKPGAIGCMSTTCAPFGQSVHFNTILVQGSPFPPGTLMNQNGQFSFPNGATPPPYVININGKRAKKYDSLIPGVTYFVYYVMSFGGIVSALSNPLKISAGN
jgi:hypothetical protein